LEASGTDHSEEIPTSAAADAPARDVSFPLLLLCFFLSGFAGLVYETAWTRQFAFVFGTSSLAVATVLAAYMGGLAAGAAVAARFAGRVRRPVLVYGLLELGIGLVALAIPYAIQAARWLYVALYGGQEALPGDGGLTTALFYLACSFVILMLPTAMMGATLPLLTRHAVRSDADVSRRTGILYAINTAGAVAGVAVAAFLLLPELGLGRTIRVAAAVNGLVFLAAWALSRSAETTHLPQPSTERLAAGERSATGRLILPLIFGSGVASFTYEVVWVRLLGHVLGGSVYAFAAMLASFLFGIAIGSAVASRFATTRERASLGFALTQIAIAATSLAAYALSNQLPRMALIMKSPDSAVSLGGLLAAMVTLFPAALFVGATFPLAVRVHTRSDPEAGAAAARVYAASTLGSIVGAVGAGFFMVPWLGFSGTFAVVAGLNLALAGLAAAGLLPHRPALGLAASVAMILVVCLPLPTPWALLMNRPLRATLEEDRTIEYFAVGRSATVLLLEEPARWRLRTNGLPEASIDRPGVIHRRTVLARWLGLSGSLARPSAKSMLVVGLGGGVVLEAVPSSVERIDVVELEQEVIRANRAVGDRRWLDPLADPRVHLRVNDARNAMLLSDRRFDLVVSQPSHPWAGGAAHLYTHEFFELAKNRLAEGGVFVQWIGLAFVDETLFRSLLATLRSVFAHVEVLRPMNAGGVLFLSSSSPIDIMEGARRALADVPDDLSANGIRDLEDVRLARILDDVDTRELARGAELIYDDHNRLQTDSPRLGASRLNARGERFMAELEAHGDADWPREGVFYALRRAFGPRTRRIAASLEEPLDTLVVEAIRALRAGRPRSAALQLDIVLPAEPRHREARALRLAMSMRDIQRGAAPGSLVEPPLTPGEEVVVSGWIAQGRGDGSAVAALEPALVEIPLLDPLYPYAAKLRMDWRIESGDPRLARDAMKIAELESWNDPDPAITLLRARAAVAAGEHLSALDALESLAKMSRRASPHSDGLRRSGLKLLDTLPRDPELAAWRAEIEQGLRVRIR